MRESEMRDVERYLPSGTATILLLAGAVSGAVTTVIAFALLGWL